MSRIVLLVVMCLGMFACLAEAGVIASTDFDGRTASGATASNLNWTTSGLSASPGDLTVSAGSLFDTTTLHQNAVIVSRNIHNVGPWSVDVVLAVGNAPIDLGDVLLDVYIVNNSGFLQGAERDVDVTVELLDGQGSLVDSAAQHDIYPYSNNPPNQPQSIALNLSGNTLAANTTSTLRLTFSGSGGGNNTGFDNLVVTNAIPTPAAGAGGLVLLAGLMTRRTRLD